VRRRHFLPWSRHPDNTIDNLVAAHPRCNNAKSASLASLEHLQRWLTRFQPGTPASNAIGHIAMATGWPRRSDRVLSTARATYLWLPERTRLWQHETTYEPLDTTRMRALFASVT
jgi:HNH endonuclease